MKESRYFCVPDAANQHELPSDEAVHAIRVLRLNEGDEIFLMDGAGSFYRAEVTLAASKHCSYQIVEHLPQNHAWRGHINLAVAPTKMMERIEWLAEKATEVGFDELSFLNCLFSERKVIRKDRIEKIVLSAVKQSRKPWMPIVNDMVAFHTFVNTPRRGAKYIAHCYDEIPREDLHALLEKAPPEEETTLLIGPEGDFSIDEVRLAIDNGFIPVTLGSSRLRTETAALFAVMMAHLSKRI
ncbi:MAG: 16S rRNA (uracil(1498)-N(3))-methyltransferase [Prevotella sp.]|nr:16S rRNA (uracil(1498)-N(3))-methyltransferase [Prevotella sp.]